MIWLGPFGILENWSLRRGGRIQENPNIVIWLGPFGILENWSLRRGGRLREVVATGGSTVDLFIASDAIFLGRKHSKNCSKCMWNVTSSMPNKLSLIDVLSWTNLKNTDLLSDDSVLTTNIWKNENLYCGFLARLFPLNVIRKFFCLVSLVCNS